MGIQVIQLSCLKSLRITVFIRGPYKKCQLLSQPTLCKQQEQELPGQNYALGQDGRPSYFCSLPSAEKADSLPMDIYDEHNDSHKNIPCEFLSKHFVSGVQD